MNLSTKSSLAAHSVTDISSARRAIKVRFFRNGDKYYKGLTFPIAFIRFKDLSNLFKALGTSIFCDQKVLPHGIRHIFDLNGKKIKCLSDLKDGGNYVCSSNNTFIPMDYLKETLNPIWKTSSQKVGDVFPLRPFVIRDTNTTPMLEHNSNGTMKHITGDQKQNSYRTIVVVKNGPTRPRKMYRWTFSLQPVPQFNALMCELCNLLDVSAISHLCTVERSKITSISEIMKVDDFWADFLCWFAWSSALWNLSIAHLNPIRGDLMVHLLLVLRYLICTKIDFHIWLRIVLLVKNKICIYVFISLQLEQVFKYELFLKINFLTNFYTYLYYYFFWYILYNFEFL